VAASGTIYTAYPSYLNFSAKYIKPDVFPEHGPLKFGNLLIIVKESINSYLQ
jgi:hypothetical protein